jgi:hypothetical protein
VGESTPGPSSLSISGARVDGKLLLLWVVAHGEGQLLVHGLDPQTSLKMGELVLSSTDWAPTGYGPLAELGPTEVQVLCGWVCGMLKLDEAGAALLLYAVDDESSLEEPASIAPRPTMLYSCAVKVSGRPLLVSFWAEDGSDEVLVRGLDTSTGWCPELTLGAMDYAELGAGPLARVDSPAALCQLVSSSLAISDDGDAIVLQIATAVAEGDGEEAQEQTAQSLSLSRSRSQSFQVQEVQQALFSQGVRLGGRWLLLCVMESDASSSELLVQGFDPSDVAR